MGKKMKIARIIILVLVVISILVQDVKLVKYISSKEEEGYWKQEHATTVQSVQTETIRTQWKAVSKDLTRIRIWAEKPEELSGSIFYQVENDTGEIVLKEQKIEVFEAWDEENGGISLDVSGIEFEAGKEYDITVRFQLEQPMVITMDANGAMFTQHYKADYQWLLCLIVAMVNLLIAGALASFWKKGWNDKLFLGISVAIGILAVFLLPPFARDDEFRHFVRAYDLSCGGQEGYVDVPHADAVGNVITNQEGLAQLIEIPKEISELRLVDYGYNYNMISYHAEINNGLCIPKLLSIFTNMEKQGTVEVSEEATAGKGLLNYWPQVLMIKLGKLLGIRSGLWYYLAGIGQVLVASIMVWLAFRFTKEHKNLITICSLIPVGMLFRASSNPDGLMMAEIILCLGIVLHLRETEMKLIGKKAIALLVVYLILVYQVCVMKMPYALLCLGFLLLLGKGNFTWLPWEKIKKYKIQIMAAGIAICILVCIYLVGIRKGDIFLAVIYKFMSQEHFAYILENLKEFLVMYLYKGGSLMKETFSALQGDYILPYGILAGLVLLLSKKKFTVIHKLYQVFLYLCVLGLIVLVGYTFTPTDYGQIVGIGYRYMLPALPILGLALPFGTEKTEEYLKQVYPLLLIPAVFASCLSWLWC